MHFFCPFFDMSCFVYFFFLKSRDIMCVCVMLLFCVCVCVGLWLTTKRLWESGWALGGGRDADKGCVMNQGGDGLCHGLPFCSTMPRLFLVSCAT